MSEYNYFVKKSVLLFPTVPVPQPDRFAGQLLVFLVFLVLVLVLVLVIVVVVTALVISAVVLVLGHGHAGRRGHPGQEAPPVRGERRLFGPVAAQAHPVMQEPVQFRVPFAAGRPVMTVHPVGQRLRPDRQQRGERQHPQGRDLHGVGFEVPARLRMRTRVFRS